MPVIKYKDALNRVLKKTVFSLDDIRHQGVPKKYSKKLFYMLAKSGKINRIERGKYTCLDDPIAVATHITKPSYLSLWTAMSIRNLTTQIPFSIDVVTSRKRFTRKVDFMGTPIVFHVVKPRMMFGYENIIWKDNIRVTVANLEKIVIDAIAVKRLPEEEVLEIVKHSDMQLLKKYAELTGNRRIKEKVKVMVDKCLHKKK